MDVVRLGIVGTGNIAQLNVAGYLEHPQCEIVAVCDAREDKARAAASAWDVARVYTSLDDLLRDDDVDAVEILTPTHVHAEHVLAAIAAGKHVSCQKPIANTVKDARRMAEAARAAGVVLRVSECFVHYPPLMKAKEIVASGAIGAPTMLRIKTVVGDTDSAFQANLDGDGYMWRFDERSPGGHLFDDMVHKYAMALWLLDQDVRNVQAVVRRGPVFFEAPTAAIFEYERDSLLGTMEVAYAPRMHIRSRYYGADEFFEIQGTDGLVWVTRATGEMLDLAPVIVYHPDGSVTSYPNVDADWLTGFRDSSRHFVDALLAGDGAPDMTPELATKTLQLCFATYRASTERRPVDPSTIDDVASPPWWPPDLHESIVMLDTYGTQ